MRVYSVGYGNRPFGTFIELVKSHGITHLVDVRSTPYSNYQVEFRQENLIDLVPSAGVRYVYQGEAFGGENVREATKETPTVRAVSLLEEGTQRLLTAAANPSNRIALMCGCLLPNSCHRGPLLGPLLVAKGIDYVHIGRNGEVLTQDEVMAQIAGPQRTLF